MLDRGHPGDPHGPQRLTGWAQWVLNAYTLTLACLLLTFGALGDRIGLRRIYIVGACVFTLAFAACATAPSIIVLIVERVAQGVGAAALLPATLALIRYLFPDRRGQTRAAVVWVGIGAGAVALGPLVGGVLIDALSWRAIFLINVPVGVVSVVLAATAIAETTASPPVSRPARSGGGHRVARTRYRGDHPRRRVRVGIPDYDRDACSRPARGRGVLEDRASNRCAHGAPGVLRRHRPRTVAVVCAALMGFLFYGTLFMMSLYFQLVRGWSPASAGIALLPLTVGTLVGPFVLYRPLARRFGHPLAAGGWVRGCRSGHRDSLGNGPRTQYVLIAAGLALIGLASTVAFSALTSLLLANVSPDHVGLASGMQNTTRQTGALMAVSILGAALNAHAIGTRLSTRVWRARGGSRSRSSSPLSRWSLPGGPQINPVEQSDRALP